MGLCGGYQMLGRTHCRSGRCRGPIGASVDGLGLLDVETVIGGDKITVPVAGRHRASGEPVTGYEIHLGRTSGPDCARPFLDLDGRPDGAQSPDGRVDRNLCPWPLRERRLSPCVPGGARGGGVRELRYEHEVEAALDALAAHLERHIDIDRLARDRGCHANAMSQPAEDGGEQKEKRPGG